MFIWPIPISLPPQPPAQVEIWPGDPELNLNIEYCGYSPDGVPVKCECTETEREIHGINGVP